jgi:hypothetical protein
LCPLSTGLLLAGPAVDGAIFWVFSMRYLVGDGFGESTRLPSAARGAKPSYESQRRFVAPLAKQTAKTRRWCGRSKATKPTKRTRFDVSPSLRCASHAYLCARIRMHAYRVSAISIPRRHRQQIRPTLKSNAAKSLQHSERVLVSNGQPPRSAECRPANRVRTYMVALLRPPNCVRWRCLA